MKRLVVCCDGTWNTLVQEELGTIAPTNVVKLYHCVLDRDDKGVEQLRYYHPGVGTEGSALARLAGAAIGVGLSRNIMSAYAWLGRHYADGDEVYLFGFSRGAYTVRSLAGMLAGGLLQLDGMDTDPALWKQVERAYERYRSRAKDRLEAPMHNGGKALDIRFLGVWDTVGALGIPNELALLNLLDKPAAWSFHDTELGTHVNCARHAIALDERRASFTPTLWTQVADRDVQQVWFPGSHSDVGGGYAGSGLSDISLEWMLNEASAVQRDGKDGLGLHREMRKQVKPIPQAPAHDTVRTVFKTLRTRPRAFPAVHKDSRALHSSVLLRQDNPPISHGAYHPTRLLALEESATVRIYAHERWNGTGLYLAAGKYRFSAKGEWLDGVLACGPDGSGDDRFHVGKLTHLVGSALGVLERSFQSLSKNKDADFVGTRRVEQAPWLALIGVVANNLNNPGIDGSPEGHEQFVIGAGAEYQVKADGYLYAFANDAWTFYENNHGSVTLEVTRLRA